MLAMSIKHLHTDSKRFYLLPLIVVMFLLSSGCSLVGISNVEEAAYTVVIKDGDFELRDYQPMVIAQTTINDEFDEAGNKAFRRLFAYISGDNTSNSEISMTAPVIARPAGENSGKKIAMTAPVLQEAGQDGWRYAFVLPAEITLETAPEPMDDKVTLAKVPAKMVAVIQYSGFWSEAGMMEKATELRSWIKTRHLKSLSEPRWAGYNPPWTIPFLRRNEVMIDVQPSE